MEPLNKILQAITNLTDHVLRSNKVSRETKKTLLYLLVMFFCVETLLITQAILFKWLTTR